MLQIGAYTLPAFNLTKYIPAVHMLLFSILIKFIHKEMLGRLTEVIS